MSVHIVRVLFTKSLSVQSMVRRPSVIHKTEAEMDHRVTTREFQLPIGIVHLTDFESHVNGVIHQMRTVLEQQRILIAGHGGVKEHPGQLISNPNIHLSIRRNTVGNAPVWKAIIDRVSTAIT